MAAALCQVPMAAVRLTAGADLTSETVFGWTGAAAAWEESICPHVLQAEGITVIEDAKEDRRFANAGYVLDEPRLRFYAGTPLIASDGERLGVLCVMDRTPHQFDQQGRDALKILADYVAARVELCHLRGERDQTEHRLRVAVESADLGTFHWTLPERVITWDDRCKAMFGLAANVCVDADMLLQLIHPDDREATVAAIDAAIANQTPYDHTYRTAGSNGDVRWVHASGRAYYDARGTPRHFDGVIRDVTRQVQTEVDLRRDVTARLATEKALRESEARFRFLSDLAEATRDLADPVQLTAAVARKLGEHLKASRCAYADVHDGEAFTILHDYTDGCATTAGDYALSAFGTRAAAEMRAGQTLVLHDVDTELTADDGADAFNAIGIKAIICCPLVLSGQLRATMAVHQATPRRWTDDEVRLVQVVVERCWAYLEQARAVRERELAFERLRLAQRAGRVGSFDWAIPQGRVVWTPELEAIYGLAEGTFEGSFDGWARRVLPNDLARVEEQMKTMMGSRERNIDFEFRIILPDGRVRWINAKAKATYDAAGKALRMIGINYDTTEQHDLAEAREALLDSERNARAEAERVGHMKDEFLATLSHELRTPLNAILGWSQIMRSGPIDATDLTQGLDTIERNARAQSQIIEDLLDMSRIVNGKVRLDVQSLDISTVIQSAAETVRPAAEAKGVRLHVVLDPSTGPVSGDPGRLQQVFWNLLNNAIKFTPKGGQVQMRLERVHSHVEVSLSDTGQGIKGEFLPYIFDRFRQADASTTRHHGGLGIGLALVKQLVELHGGTAMAKSPGEGRGSTFVVMLPLTIIHAADPDCEPPRRHPTADCAPSVFVQNSYVQIAGIRVLVVDDEADACGLVRRLLEDCQATVECASSADEAMEKLSRGRFDVIVSDIGMPGEDGYSLIRRIRQLPPDAGGQMPALALTAYARSEDRMRSVVSGFQMHIPKPVEPAELITMVASLAGRSGMAAVA